MLRENLQMGARSVSLLCSKREGVRLLVRDETDQETRRSTTVEGDLPVWLKLSRRGDLFTGYTSKDGQRWTPIGEPLTVKMAAPIMAGMTVTAGNRDGSRHQAASFDNVVVE